MPVRIGLERLLDGPDRALLAGRRLGLVSNPASIDSALVHASDRLFGAGDWTLTTLFGPQHGFHSDLQENMIESPHARDAKRRLPVYSLYSETREPTAEMLADVDVLVVDLQDVGSHLYLHLYAGQLPARRARPRQARGRLRSSQPDRRRGGGGGGARRGVCVVCRTVSDSHAARPDHRRSGAAVQRAVRPQRRARRDSDAGLDAI